MSHIQAYEQLQQLILASQQELATAARSDITKTVQAIDVYFREQILTATAQHHGIQVEINKQLRLLKTDCLFLRSAKQTTTQDQRLQQMRDRLTLLERYCAMILG